MDDALITINQLDADTGLGWHAIDRALKKAGIKPAHTFRSGRGVGKLYDAAALMKIAAEMKASQKPPEPKAEPAPPPAATDATPFLAGIRSLADGLAGLQARFDDLEESLAASFKLATEQNAALLRAIEALKPAPHVGPATAQTGVMTAPPPSTKLHVVEPPKPAPKRKRIVTIVGLTQAMYAEIEREFGDSFELRHWEASEVRRPNFVIAIKSSDAVIAMVKFIGHDAMHKMSAAGVKATPINGGMSSLRTELTRLFCSDEVAA